jgi:hypothetical protein
VKFKIGYGIGALLSVQIAKPFIKFDLFDKLQQQQQQQQQLDHSKLENTSVNEFNEFNFTDNHINVKSSNNTITSDDIQIALPYSIAGGFGILLTVLFLIAQIIEKKNTSVFNKNYGNQIRLLEKQNKHPLDKSRSLFQKLMFGSKEYKGASLFYMIAQISLIAIMFFIISGYIIVITKFMQTYLTKGPGKLSINEYANLQALFWIVFILARFISAFLAFKINNVIFYLVLVVLNLLFTFFLIIPYLTKFKLFFWIVISLLGFTSSPLQPSGLMVAKCFVLNYNTFVLSIFSIGAGIGAMVFQQIVGDLLDFLKPSSELFGFVNFEPAFIIGHSLFLPSLITFLIYIIILIIYKRYFYLIDRK